MQNGRNKTIRFTKASACGNDFLIVSAFEDDANLAEISRALCDRHNGVGADGAEWVFSDSQADARVRLFNADGSEAEISGNGTRCVAAEICSRAAKQKVVIRTEAGLKTCKLMKREGTTFEFESAMGSAIIGEQLTVEVASRAGREFVTGVPVSTGNPHFVILCESFPDGWQRQAAAIQKLLQFPQGTNVEYVVVRGTHKSAHEMSHEIDIRLFERGVGETLSSGTGSCAAAVAAIASGRVSSPVTVVAPGGTQTVRSEEQVYLRGPATLICQGEYFIQEDVGR
ncbi:MAG: diaminopimelate epimerase [Mycobacterium sp.]